MPAEVLRRAVHDHRRAQIERPAQQRRRERVVDEKRHPPLAGDRRDRFQVRYATERVGDGLGDDEPGARDRPPHSIEVGQIDELGLIAGGLEVLAQKGCGAAVELARRHDRRRLRDEREDGPVQRRHPGCGGHACVRPLQLGDRSLEHLAVAVRVAAVVVAGPLAARDGVVIVEIGEHMHRRGAEVWRERAPSPQVAARVHSPRSRFHSLVAGDGFARLTPLVPMPRTPSACLTPDVRNPCHFRRDRPA